MTKPCALPSLLICLYSTLSIAQENDLLKELEKTKPGETEYAMMTFKGTRLVNGHSVETKGKGDLEFIFAHRFGPLNSGSFELYGLDDAYVRLGLDFGITRNFSASVGRNSVDKSLDGYIKYKISRQQSGSRNFPLSITGLGGLVYKASPRRAEVQDGFTAVDRLAYIAQILIARKINTNLSLQLMPTMVHKNAVDQTREHNDQFAIGAGGRVRVTKSVALTGEYYHRLKVHPANPYYNTLGFGVDIETGGHVFQLVFTNTRGLTERAFIMETEGDFADGDIHFGFNVTRTFRLKKNDE